MLITVHICDHIQYIYFIMAIPSEYTSSIVSDHQSVTCILHSLKEDVGSKQKYEKLNT